MTSFESVGSRRSSTYDPTNNNHNNNNRDGLRRRRSEKNSTAAAAVTDCGAEEGGNASREDGRNQAIPTVTEKLENDYDMQVCLMFHPLSYSNLDSKS